MELFSESQSHKLYQGNMLDMLEVIEPNSIDAIVTDPPYELNFMNKGWDRSGIAFQKETWEKCLKVLKPGGYLLAFGGSRTSHRIACAIEDAGFEIRDTIMWLYGCLSEDTEVLTQQGFKQFHKITNSDKIRVYDIKAGIYKWETPQQWSVYKTEQDTCYRIKSDSTDQLVSRNHRCLVEREGKLVFEFAENLRGMERVPVLSYDIPYLQEGCRNILLTDLLWQDERLVKKLFTQWVGKEESEERASGEIKFRMERWSNLSEQERKLCQSENKVCSVSERVYIDGEKRWICNGTSVTGGSTDRETFVEHRSRTSQESQCGGQQIGESDVICNKQRSQDVRGWKTYTTTLATVTPEQYSGIIFCPTVSTGCFVARRNGKVFITGNSGFPKSMNIGLAIDKKNGVESELGGVKPGHQDFVNRTTNGDTRFEDGMSGFDRPWMHDDEKREAYHYEKLPTSEEAKRWQGWGTALKPAYEPIIVARKPCEGSCVDNVLKYGVGGINIDECRVPANPGEYDIRHYTNEDCFQNLKPKQSHYQVKPQPEGRFPANVILTYDDTDFDEVCGGMPTGGANGTVSKAYDYKADVFGDYKQKEPFDSYGDSGSAARYYYCAKASKRDRDEGLDAFETKYVAFSNQGKAELNRGNVDFSGDSSSPLNAFNKVQSAKNTHPTVKPCSLMQYLIRLVTPKGGTILDPFNGSGSTGKAAMYENVDRKAGYKYIGIELTPEYLPIADARIRFALGDTSPVEYPSMPVSRPKAGGQISLFDIT